MTCHVAELFFPRETKSRASREARVPRLSSSRGPKAAPSSRAAATRGAPRLGGRARAFDTKAHATRNRFSLTSISRKGSAAFSNKFLADRAFWGEVFDRVERVERVDHGCTCPNFEGDGSPYSVRSSRLNLGRLVFPSLATVRSSESAEAFSCNRPKRVKAFVSREAGFRGGRDDTTPGQGLATRRGRRAMPQASGSTAAPRRQSRSRDVVAFGSRGAEGREARG